MSNYAIARPEIADELEDRIYPPLEGIDFSSLKLRYMLLDKDDGHFLHEAHNPWGMNMIILDPVQFSLHWCYSIDFDFIEEAKNESPHL